MHKHKPLTLFIYLFYLSLARWWGAAALVALWMRVGGWGVCAQVSLGWKAASVLLGPRGNLHGRQLSCVQLLRGRREEEKKRMT